jgi:hypothetical protein
MQRRATRVVASTAVGRDDGRPMGDGSAESVVRRLIGEGINRHNRTVLDEIVTDVEVKAHWLADRWIVSDGRLVGNEGFSDAVKLLPGWMTQP